MSETNPPKQEPDSDEEDEDLRKAGKLTLVVHYMNGEETVFVVKTTTLFAKIKQSLSKKYGITDGTVSLRHDGSKCMDNVNPKLMEMMAGKTYHIDAFLEQVGGGTVSLIKSKFRAWLTSSVVERVAYIEWRDKVIAVDEQRLDKESTSE